MSAIARQSPSDPSARSPRWVAGVLVAQVVTLFCGCASVELRRTLVDNRDVAGGPESGVTVVRQGARLDVTPGMALQPSDSVQTGGRSSAVIWFDGQDEIIVLPNTKVHIHSIWIEFGKILARIHGKFRIESESVVAGVEGTEFLLQAGGPDAMGVTVVRGSVRLTSKNTGNSIVVNTSETGSISRSGAAAKRPLSDKEAREIDRQLAGFREAVRTTDRRRDPSPVVKPPRPPFPDRPGRPNRPDRDDDRDKDPAGDKPVDTPGSGPERLSRSDFLKPIPWVKPNPPKPDANTPVIK